MLRTVSIMPGMENLAPDRTLTSSGSAGSPSLRPIVLFQLPQVPADLVVEPVGDGALAPGTGGTPRW